jgi:hypothetical protein
VNALMHPEIVEISLKFHCAGSSGVGDTVPAIGLRAFFQVEIYFNSKFTISNFCFPCIHTSLHVNVGYTLT